MKLVPALALAATAAVAAMTLNTPVQAAAHCGEAIENPRPAFNANGQRFGTIIKAIKDDSGEATSYVLQESGVMYGYTGGSRVLPAEYVEFLAGRAKILLQDPASISSFPAHNC